MRARTTKINRAATPPRHDLEHYCRDLNGWPRSWMGLEKDLPPGEQLVALFRPFLEQLAASDLSPKTIQKHVDNMWALGGEFIRDLHNDPSLRKKPVDRDPPPDDRVRRAAPLSRRRRSAEILRFHLPKVPPVPHRDGSLTLAVTHKFPRRGKKIKFGWLGIDAGSMMSIRTVPLKLWAPSVHVTFNG